MKRMCTLLCLLVSIINVSLAQFSNISSYKGKEIAFVKPTDSLALTCFYDLDVLHKGKFKDKFLFRANDAGITPSSEIFDFVFLVEDVVFTVDGDESKGISLVLKREDGMELVLRIPPFNPKKRHKMSGEYSDSFLATSEVGPSAWKDFWHRFEYGTSIKTLQWTKLAFVVHDITEAKGHVNELCARNIENKYSDLVYVTNYVLKEFSFIDGVPNARMVADGVSVDVDIDSLGSLNASHRKRMLHYDVVDSCARYYDKEMLQNFERDYVGKNVWLTNLYDMNYTGESKSSKSNYVYECLWRKGRRCERVTENNMKWMNGFGDAYEKLSTCMIGGDEEAVVKAKCIGLKLMSVGYPLEQLLYPKKPLTKLAYQYYAIFTRREEAEYKAFGPNSSDVEIDTLYIPFPQGNAEGNAFSKFYKRVRSDAEWQQFKMAWNKNARKEDVFYNTLTTARREYLIETYGQRIGDKLNRGLVEFGFTEEMCKEAYWMETCYISKVDTPLGMAVCYHFKESDTRLYFRNSKLMGIRFVIDTKIKWDY